ncbi:hypothetical protein LH20_04130 [Sphingopyxis sp. 113P3]|nr:hypothetical protein LH20_04130 [Sphingopyxis sp. 113P3]
MLKQVQHDEDREEGLPAASFAFAKDIMPNEKSPAAASRALLNKGAAGQNSTVAEALKVRGNP